jgi:hypothetical protein
MAIGLYIFSFLCYFLDTKCIESNEELVLNTVATLNNLSFYQDGNSVVLQRQLDITECKYSTRTSV